MSAECEFCKTPVGLFINIKDLKKSICERCHRARDHVRISKLIRRKLFGDVK